MRERGENLIQILEGLDEVISSLVFLLDEPGKVFQRGKEIALNSILARLSWAFFAFYVMILKNSRALYFRDGVNLGNYILFLLSYSGFRYFL